MPSRFAGKKEILQILMRDGSIEVDTGAIKIGAQLVSNSLLNGVALPVRQPTATYEHKEINRAPIKRRSVHFETVDPIAPDFDSQFTLRDSPNIWQASSLELDREQNDSNRTNNLFQGIALLAASIGFLMSLSTTAFVGGDSEAELLAEKEANRGTNQAGNLRPRHRHRHRHRCCPAVKGASQLRWTRLVVQNQGRVK